MREFTTGATRNNDEGKFDYEGFLSPAVIDRFAEYMHKHRVQADGKLRDSDNWQKGMPRDAYMKSGYRHFMDWWKEHRGIESREGLEEALCALLFNVQGYLHEVLLGRDVGRDDEDTVYDITDKGRAWLAGYDAGKDAGVALAEQAAENKATCEHWHAEPLTEEQKANLVPAMRQAYDECKSFGRPTSSTPQYMAEDDYEHPHAQA